MPSGVNDILAISVASRLRSLDGIEAFTSLQ